MKAARSPFRSPSSIRTSRSSARTAGRWLLGVFVNCFTPPDSSVAKASGDSDVFEKSHGNRRTSYTCSNSKHSSIEGGEVWNMQFTMEDISHATRHFSPSLKIGQGGFGTVYRGTLKDGTVVAIKRAKKTVFESHVGTEFRSETQTLAQIEHLNLVKFYGYLEHLDERILVVEYVPNGTLREHLDCKGGQILDVASRLDIAIDVAHAVTYLHMYTDHPIIHRDIKSSNILLTDKLRAKVADFGFARLLADSETNATHVSTQVKGTVGYLDPEYLTTYHLTEKSDVYSFGALLVELVTGRRPIEAKYELKQRITTTWAFKKVRNGETISVFDPMIERNPANCFALEKILELAFQCLARHREPRPSMNKCAEVLWGIRKDYGELSGVGAGWLSSQPLKTS